MERMPTNLRFAEGEKVLCYHGPLIYEAKCLKSSITKDEQPTHLVHYIGWNKNWDEWVPECRVMKYNHANIAKQVELQRANSNQLVKKKVKLRKPDHINTKDSDSLKSESDEVKHSNVSQKKVLLDPFVESENRFIKKIEDTDSRGVSPTIELVGATADEYEQWGTLSCIQYSVSDVESKQFSSVTGSLPDIPRKKFIRIDSGSGVPGKTTDRLDSTVGVSGSDGTTKKNTCLDPSMGLDNPSLDIEPLVGTPSVESEVKQLRTPSCNQDNPNKSDRLNPSVELQDLFVGTDSAGVNQDKAKQLIDPSCSNDSDSNVQKSKKSRLDPTVETEEQFLKKVEVRVKIPEVLKLRLVDDWDIITRSKRLVSLPASMSVDRIINKYVSYKKTMMLNNTNEESAMIEVMEIIREYFNVMLGKKLLYESEVPQYAEMLRIYPETQASEIYGAVHLLRLFVKLGTALAYTDLDEMSMELLLQNVQEFLIYLIENSATLFSLRVYSKAQPDYYSAL